MVGSGGNAPLVTSDFFLRHWFYRPAAGTLPFEIGSGSGSHTHLKKFMRLLSVHWSSFPQLKLACRAVARSALPCRVVGRSSLRYGAAALLFERRPVESVGNAPT